VNGVDIHGYAAPGDSGLFSHQYRCTRCSESWSEVEFITPAEAEERAKAHRCEPKDVVC